MEIILNGTPTQVIDRLTMAELIEHLGLTGRRLAVEVNGELVPRGRFTEHQIASADRVEIIHAVGGG